MKALPLLKKEVMHFDISSYLIWISGVIVGCFAYLNPPLFIVELGGVFTFFRKTGELVWGLGAAFLMGIVAVLATKIGTRLWDDKVKPFYERLINGKKKK